MLRQTGAERGGWYLSHHLPSPKRVRLLPLGDSKASATGSTKGQRKVPKGKAILVATAEVFFWEEAPGRGVSSMGGRWVWRG